MSCDAVGNIRIEPMDVNWDIEQKEVIDFKSATASGLGGQYFNLWSANDAVAYYVWFDENNTDTDPAVVGKTAIEVNYAASASATAIASAAAAAIAAVTGFIATASGTKVTITRTAVGSCTETSVGTATSLSIATCQYGGDFYLGLLDGEISINPDVQLFQVTAHQFGSTNIAELIQATNVEVTLTMKEVDKENLGEILQTVGGSFTPGGGTELYGYGTSKIGENVIKYARRLTLHPVRLAANDYSEDHCIWKAFPVPGSLTFSPTDPKVMEITFRAYADDSIDESIRIWSVGDWTQLIPED